jgi:hypothetical protein
MLPEQKFLLVTARNSGRVSPLPENVEQVPLAAYAVAPSRYRAEARSLRAAWKSLQLELAQAAPEFELAAQVGLFARMDRMLDWGLALREAWREVFETENVIGCLSADEGNPSTRLPLMLAAQRGMPAVACHHGALDSGLAFRRSSAQTYLVKDEMERDYAVNVCRLQGASMLHTPRDQNAGLEITERNRRAAPWLVFFTEPYEVDGGRTAEIYREVVPALCQLARTHGKRLVLKLHPFESAKQRALDLRQVLPREDLSRVDVIAQPMSSALWQRVWAAVTIQSTVAVEASALGIPVFLLGWLAHAWTGYAPQFAKFGAGTLVRSADDLRTMDPADRSQSRLPRERVAQPTSGELAQVLLHKREARVSAPAAGS